MKTKQVLFLAALAATGSAVAMLAWPDKASPPSELAVTEAKSVVTIGPMSAAATDGTPRAAARNAPPESASGRREAASPGGDRGEAALMANLRGLGSSDPALSLKLASQGNERFKDSPNAAEREWIVIKSLANMGRLDDARTEARRLIDKYPGTSWADDVHRHLFVNPPNDPSERGYGKTTELEE